MEMKPQNNKGHYCDQSYISWFCGLAISSWAHHVPYAKDRIRNHGKLIWEFYFFAFGCELLGDDACQWNSFAQIRYAPGFMPVAATGHGLYPAFTADYSSPVWMGVSLFLFGGALGTVDVAMNAHGVQCWWTYLDHWV
ncbi:hypothetical protein FQR65_LT17878 [Abscondita terminalis]|nr:hypothetical protein FQR65_LT17878 [Abscondita terminalis]